jgi:hypothetical protein
LLGGIAVTYWDEDHDGEPIGTFTSFPELNTILHKVVESGIAPLERLGITSSRTYRYTDKLYEDHPGARALRPEGNTALVNTNAFEQFAFLYHTDKPADGNEYARVFGLAGRSRAYRWIRRDYLQGPGFDRFKVIVPKARGHLGTLGNEPALVVGAPVVGEPGVAVTQSFITIGAFDDEATADACLKYVKSKFARALLGVLKVTQDNPAKVWKYVPLQDFTTSSDVDWTKPIPEIDRQLYAKYGLDSEEIAFIEAKVKPME